MARFSRNRSSPARPSMSRWMTALYVCAVLIAPMLFMGMIPSARAQDAAESKADGVSGPGMSSFTGSGLFGGELANVH